MQKLTTKEPDGEMIAAAIVSSLAVMDDELFYEYAPEEFLHIHPDYVEEEKLDEDGNVIPAPKKEYEIVDFNKVEAQEEKSEATDDNASDSTDEQVKETENEDSETSEAK